MAKRKTFDHLFKIVVIGDYGSGKTSLIHKFSKLEIPQFGIGIDFQIYTIELDLKIIKLQIWDTTPSPRVRVVARSTLRSAHGVMMVYDVTNRESFNHIRRWKDNVDQCVTDEDMVLMLVGNKCDLHNQRQVSIKEGKQMAEEFGIWFMETSTHKDSNVEQAFVSLIQDIKKIKEARAPEFQRSRFGSCTLF